jgi:uncharacterized integral membrane protein (TIGR00697 family)
MNKIQYSKSPKILNLKCILPLALLYLTVYLAADSVSYKLVQLGPILEPGPPFIFPLTYAISDIITEVYGARQAKQIVLTTLFLQIFYAVVVFLIIQLPSPTTWHGQEHYEYVFGHILRFVFAGTCAVLISNIVNIYVISKLKWIMGGRKFWVRGLLSSGLGGITLVTIIVCIGYSGSVDLKQAIQMWFSINLLEMFYVLILLTPVWIIAMTLKNIEKIDVYDDLNFNPFKQQKKG